MATPWEMAPEALRTAYKRSAARAVRLPAAGASVQALRRASAPEQQETILDELHGGIVLRGC
jgi:hypothetical protein